ncbi:MAG: VanZ family protein [Deltaproteobacteria bacterium]|nr:VanZ family protein [Deltaproteobacteria bacterium]
MGINKTENNSENNEALTGKRALKYGGLWRAIGFLIILLIIVLSLVPNPEEISPVSVSDKLLHIIAYAASMFWFGLCIKREKLYIAGIILAVLGIIIEFIQGQTGYREMSLYDIYANIAGILIGFLLSLTRLSLALHYIEKKLFR